MRETKRQRERQRMGEKKERQRMGEKKKTETRMGRRERDRDRE